MIRIAAHNWYRVQNVGDDVTLIDEPYIKPFYRCNIWHIRGRDRDALVEDYAKDDIFDSLPPALYRSDLYSVRAALVMHFLADGDIVDLGDRWFKVFHLSGHSPGGIVLYEEVTGIFFSGDTIYDGPLVEDVYHSNLDGYYVSMLRHRVLFTGGILAVLMVPGSPH